MALLAAFLFGVLNFAMHQAVLRSRHVLLRQAPFSHLAGRISLGVEFVVLLAVLLLVGNGYAAWAWVYGGYSALNGLAAWLILSRRI